MKHCSTKESLSGIVDRYTHDVIGGVYYPRDLNILL